MTSSETVHDPASRKGQAMIVSRAYTHPATTVNLYTKMTQPAGRRARRLTSRKPAVKSLRNCKAALNRQRALARETALSIPRCHNTCADVVVKRFS
jgi:hypothetical protein